MILSARLLLSGMIMLAGCQTAQRVAVTSFHVIDTPARLIRDRIDPPETTTTTTTRSDVSNPGQPIETAPAPNPRPEVVTRNRSNSVATAPPRPRAESTVAAPRKSTPSASPRVASSQAPQFPTARPVAGKPGYVYSVDPKGGIVDVTGYKSGDKAKDPYTQQIFIVP